MSELYLIFDFDGVIGDTRQASAEASAIASNSSVEEALANNLRYASQKPNHTKNHTLSDVELKKIYDWTRRFGEAMLKSDFSLFSDFVEEIEALETRYKAVVSSGSQLYVLPALQRTTIQPTHVLTYEDHHSKEEKIELICKDWGISPTDAYYFTDTLADVYELQDFISTDKLIGVAWGYCGYNALKTVLDQKHILKTASDFKYLFK